MKPYEINYQISLLVNQLDIYYETSETSENYDTIKEQIHILDLVSDFTLL